MAPFSSCAFFSPASVLRVVGPDSLSFLQGQFTQELRRLEASQVAYGLWLNQKGKLLGDSHAIPVGPEEWLLVSEQFTATALLARLEAYLIADEVELKDETALWQLEAHWGESAPRPGAAHHWRNAATLPGGLALRARTSEGTGHVSPASTDAGPLAYRRQRYLSLLPSIPGDLGEGDLPQEAGLEAMAVSFTKGCYLGQEIMARLHALGQVRRRLVRVRGEGPPPSPASAVCGPDGKRVGDVRGAIAEADGWLGLAMVQRSALGGGPEGSDNAGPPVARVWTCGEHPVQLDSSL